MRAHPLAPGGDRAGEALPRRASAREVDVLGRVDDHLVARRSAGATRRGRARRTRDDWRSGSIELANPVSAPPASSPAAGLLGDGQHRVEVRNRARRPARGVGLAAVRARRPDLGRRPVLAALAERAGLGGVLARPRAARGEGVGALGPAGREDRPQAGELVDADLGRGSACASAAPGRAPARAPSPRRARGTA